MRTIDVRHRLPIACGCVQLASTVVQHCHLPEAGRRLLFVPPCTGNSHEPLAGFSLHRLADARDARRTFGGCPCRFDGGRKCVPRDGEAEWEYACRGGRTDSSFFWWGSNLDDAKGRLNISGLDLLPGKDYAWPGAKLPWLDGYAMVSPVDHYGARGRNGFGLADMCGGVWEFVIDHFDPKGGHEEVFYEAPEKRTVSRPVCRGGNYYDVPGNARCAVRLGIASVTYSDSRDGFRICLGRPVVK